MGKAKKFTGSLKSMSGKKNKTKPMLTIRYSKSIGLKMEVR